LSDDDVHVVDDDKDDANHDYDGVSDDDHDYHDHDINDK